MNNKNMFQSSKRDKEYQIIPANNNAHAQFPHNCHSFEDPFGNTGSQIEREEHQTQKMST